jgi:hypothetical protein
MKISKNKSYSRSPTLSLKPSLISNFHVRRSTFEDLSSFSVFAPLLSRKWLQRARGRTLLTAADATPRRLSLSIYLVVGSGSPSPPFPELFLSDQ